MEMVKYKELKKSIFDGAVIEGFVEDLDGGGEWKDAWKLAKCPFLIMITVGIVMSVSIVLVILIWKIFLNLVFGAPL